MYMNPHCQVSIDMWSVFVHIHVHGCMCVLVYTYVFSVQKSTCRVSVYSFTVLFYSVHVHVATVLLMYVSFELDTTCAYMSLQSNNVRTPFGCRSPSGLSSG